MPIMERDKTPRRSRPHNDVWISPFHARDARMMERDYPRNERGEPIRDNGKFLVVDNRPTIMRKESKPMGVDKMREFG